MVLRPAQVRNQHSTLARATQGTQSEGMCCTLLVPVIFANDVLIYYVLAPKVRLYTKGVIHELRCNF